MENNNIAENLEDFNNIVVANYSYDNGFLDGILGIEPEHFRHFIDNNGNRNLEKLELARLGTELLERENELENVKTKLIENNNLINTANNEIIFLNTKIQTKEQSLKKQQDFLDCRAAYLDSIPSKTVNLTVAIIFLLVALCFLIADIVVIGQVLYDIMANDASQKIEAIIYATAIALVSFAIKPGIERILEKPYLVNEKKKRNHIFYVMLIIFILTTTACIGYVRFLSITQDVDSNFFLMLGIVGCAIIFPICGSICMSIGITSIDLFRKKKIANKLILKITFSLSEVRKEIKNFQISKENAIFALSLLRNPNEIISEISMLKDNITKHLELFYNQEIEADKNIYEQAKARGERYQLTEELRITPAKIAVLLGIWPPVNKGSGAKNANVSNSLGPKSKSGYLHEQLRSMIEYNHKKN